MFVTAGTLIVTNRNAIEDGTSLTVGNAGLFAPVVPNLSASGQPPGLACAGTQHAGASHRNRLRRGRLSTHTLTAEESAWNEEQTNNQERLQNEQTSSCAARRCIPRGAQGVPTRVPLTSPRLRR